MKVRIERRWDRNTVQVWAYDEGRPIRVWRYHPDETWSWSQEEVSEGAVLPVPTLELPTSMLAALVEASSDLVPPNQTMAEAWKDAREVRDRLLSLVESS